MIRIICLAAAGAIALAASAFAQTGAVDRGAVARSIVQVCVASPMGENVQAPEVGCACLVGVLSARMNDRQFGLMGRIAPYIFNSSSVDGLEAQLLSEGYTQAEFSEAARIIRDATPISNGTCWPLRR